MRLIVLMRMPHGDSHATRHAIRGRISRIVRTATHDGPGIRTLVYFKGCPMHCGWCHSPETQALDAEVLLREDRCIACGACLEACGTGAARLAGGEASVDRARCARCGRCAERCPSGARELHGTVMDVDAIMDVIRRDVPFYDASGGGVTFSGGEPLLQPALLAALLARCRHEGIAAAIETCGHASRRALQQVADHAPLFLFDIKILDDERHLAATGLSNRRLLANLRTLAAQRAAIVLRFPLVPGVTDAKENVRAIAALAVSIGVRRIDVLPYHRAGIVKYARLGREYSLADVPAATTDDAADVAAEFRANGMDARIGGMS